MFGCHSVHQKEDCTQDQSEGPKPCSPLCLGEFLLVTEHNEQKNGQNDKIEDTKCDIERSHR